MRRSRIPRDPPSRCDRAGWLPVPIALTAREAHGCPTDVVSIRPAGGLSALVQTLGISTSCACMDQRVLFGKTAHYVATLTTAAATVSNRQSACLGSAGSAH